VDQARAGLGCQRERVVNRTWQLCELKAILSYAELILLIRQRKGNVKALEERMTAPFVSDSEGVFVDVHSRDRRGRRTAPATAAGGAPPPPPRRQQQWRPPPSARRQLRGGGPGDARRASVVAVVTITLVAVVGVVIVVVFVVVVVIIIVIIAVVLVAVGLSERSHASLR
jgi:hypothetical protein